MKNLASLLIVFLSSTAAFAAQAGPTPVSVARFKQEAGRIYDGCRGWDYAYQDQLQTELERELSERGLKVLERRDIRKIHNDEFQMSNLDQKTVQKRNKFIAAKYTITGAITELGVCEESSGGGVQLGGISSLLGGPAVDLEVGGKKSTSKVKLVTQIVLVETGEILKSFSAKSEIKDSGANVRGSTLGIGAKGDTRTKPPIERASNEAIKDLASQIATYLEVAAKN